MLVEIKEIDPAAGQEYSVTGYPGPGLYYVRRIESLVLVRNSLINWFNLPEVFLRDTCAPEFKAGPLQVASEAPMVTGDVLLKAIAIAQDPSLAKGLL